MCSCIILVLYMNFKYTYISLCMALYVNVLWFDPQMAVYSAGQVVYSGQVYSAGQVLWFDQQTAV